MERGKVIGVMLLFCVIKATASLLAKPGCQDICGNVKIPYPFGIGSDCSANQTFSITCRNNSKPFLDSIHLQVLDIRLETSTIHVNNIVTMTSDCPTASGISKSAPHPNLNLSATPFSFNSIYNLFVGIGCDKKRQVLDARTNGGRAIVVCFSMCSNDTSTDGSGCYGTKCCQAVSFSCIAATSITNTSSSMSIINSRGGCGYSYILQEEWFGNFGDHYTVEGRQNVPLVLDWRTDEKCYLPDMPSWSGSGYLKYCSCDAIGTKGNAYLPNGCKGPSVHSTHPKTSFLRISILMVCLLPCGSSVLKTEDFSFENGAPTKRDINECEDSTMCSDNMICIKDQRGNYCKSPTKSNTVMIVVGIGSGLGGLFIVIGAWWLWKIIKRRKKAKLKKKFFKQNGGLLLQQQYLTSADKGYVEKTKLFTSKELDKATDGYNQNRILGHGGQGTVYKGMLTDGKIVAIKKSKIVDEGKLNEFINEVVILSQINHRNVVKLHGCCLETQVPMLVYDFIPNGTLFHYIHHQQNEDFSFSWNVRLRIASEVAEALSYLHSAASQPIYHRDIKSSNILLDEKYRAKVADFGTSRSSAIDQTHMTTRVQGTFGYLDPEYFQSSQFTAKSDVYSFGVVLLELLTGQKAVLPITFEDGRSLASYFMFSMKENRLFDILDAQVLKEGRKEEINGVANLARRCLNLNGKKRPTMKEVAMELEAIRISSRAL